MFLFSYKDDLSIKNVFTRIFTLFVIISVLFTTGSIYVEAAENYSISYATVINDGTADYEDEIKATINSFPAYLQDILASYTICLYGYSTAVETIAHKDAYGALIFDYKTIYVESLFSEDIASRTQDYYPEVSANKKCLMFTKAVLGHECGHVFDKTLGLCSSSPEFSQIYNEELDYFICSEFLLLNFAGEWGSVHNSEEYFASTYGCYLLAPKELKEFCPKTYNYIITAEYNYKEAHGYEVAPLQLAPIYEDEMDSASYYDPYSSSAPYASPTPSKWTTITHPSKNGVTVHTTELPLDKTTTSSRDILSADVTVERELFYRWIIANVYQKEYIEKYCPDDFDFYKFVTEKSTEDK